MHSLITVLSLGFILAGCQESDGLGFRNPSEDREDSDSNLSVSDQENETLSSEGCPSGMVLIDGGTFVVGAPPELAEQDDKSRIPIGEITLNDFCITELPFPGQGLAWPTGGLNGEMVAAIDNLLTPTGRRISTGSEYLVATATEFNDQWPNGASSWTSANCDPDQDNPGLIGDYPDCTSSYGVGGLLTFSFWVKNDDRFSDMLLGSQNPGWSDENYIVVGGTPISLDPYYGSDLFGVHGHDDDTNRYSDDNGLFLVAVPNAVTEEQESAFVAIIEVFKTSDGDWSNLVS